MENQINMGDQNNQQIDQNPINQPMVAQEKPRINYWAISIISLVAIFLLFFVWFFLGRMNQNNLTNRPTQIPTSFLTPTASVSTEPVSVETIKLEPSSIGDSATELFFTEDDSLYSVKGDGLIKKLAKTDGNIVTIAFLPGKNDLFIQTEKPEIKQVYVKYLNKMVPMVDSHTACWIFRNDSQKLEKLVYSLRLPDIGWMTRFEKVYTKENDSGGAEILLDKLDGSQPIRIGFLKEKLLETVCEFADCTKEKYHPHLFVPSFDGSFLLSVPGGGGGLGEPAVVVSKDGSKIYKIDFYWYVSAAVWIDSNKLLAQDQKGAKLFTFNDDGTFKTTNLSSGIGDNFSQNTLSPNRKLLAVLTNNPNLEVSLLDTSTFEKRSVEIVKFGARVVGWNKDSNKLLCIDGDEAKIYDVSSGKTNIVASLKNGAPTWVTSDRDAFATNIFEIR